MTITFDSELDEDDMVSQEFNDRFGRPELEKKLSYKVVGRLSRWEGGESSPYNASKVGGGAEKVEAETMSIMEFVRHLVRPTYDLTEVTIEDIERVKVMHDRFLGDAQFSFNYTTLLVIASVIAGVGLGVNSSASIIASMLVSPLMGPVTAIAYGITIGDYKMVRMAVVTELASLTVCIVTGLVVAGCMLPLPISQDWPVSEMTSRGIMSNFYAGIPIAFFSGLGVAVGLLDSQTNSLVGVAISASLLPPAVNAGMLWVIDIGHEDNLSSSATISLLLTVMNIFVIIVASIIMFRLKETLPIEKSIFWTDLGVARKIYHNVAIIPHLQEPPTDQEIQNRVMRFFPRCSEMARTRPSVFKTSRKLNVVASDDDDEDDSELMPSSMGLQLQRISEE